MPCSWWALFPLSPEGVSTSDIPFPLGQEGISNMPISSSFMQPLAFNLSLLCTFSPFAQRAHIGSRSGPCQDIAFRVSGEDITIGVKHKTLDELGLLVFLERLERGRGWDKGSVEPG